VLWMRFVDEERCVFFWQGSRDVLLKESQWFWRSHNGFMKTNARSKHGMLLLITGAH
jgi:hypothetical protein